MRREVVYDWAGKFFFCSHILIIFEMSDADKFKVVIY